MLQVNFTDGTQIPIHLNIIQAFVILLTYSSMLPNSQPILDYWFPPGAAPPQAFTLDANNESVQILPDWLKLKMIRSPVERLVDAALLELTPDQIVLFVQNFGTPVNSMSKLLALLDRAVIEQLDTVKLAILNKAYLAQLIEIQQQRGAKNGHIAVHSLDLHGKIVPDIAGRSANVLVDVSAAVDAAAVREPVLPSRTKEIEDVVELVLTKKHPLDRLSGARVRRIMQQLIANDVPERRLGGRLTASYGTADNMQSFTATKVLQYLHRVVQSSRGPYVLQNLQQTPAVCSLFRTLMTWQPAKPEAQAFMLQVVDQCMQHISPKTVPVLFQIVLKKRNAYAKACTKTSASDAVAAKSAPAAFESNTIKTESGAPIVVSQILDDLKNLLKSANTMELESQGKRAIAELSKSTDTDQLVGAITTTLQTQCSERTEKIGLLIDWLANIDSELVPSSGGHQLDLLFSKSPHHFHFYLLSLLSHQASWSTLSRTVGRLLGAYQPHYDPTAVLHFIDALIGNPKLWQGRDKATPKHEQVEPVLLMTSKQVEVFADYALTESTATGEQRRLSERLQILLKCVRTDTFNLRRLVRYVRTHPLAARDRCAQFLQQLYLNVPPMRSLPALAVLDDVDDDLADVYQADAKPLIGCQLDVIANYTLTSLSSMTSAREFTSMSAEMELIVRKLAATHPALILRHLSVLAALLQGRAHMDWHMVRQKSLQLFNQVLGLLELLQPLLFAEAHRDALHLAMDCYFTLLRHHGHKDIYILLCRFMELLQAYTNHNANRALNYVEQYAELMQMLSQRNRSVTALQQLVQGISLLKHRHAHDFRNLAPEPDESGGANGNGAAGDESVGKATTSSAQATASSSGSGAATATAGAQAACEPDSTGAAAVILAPYTKSSQIPHQWPAMLNAALRREGADVLGPLQEIEGVTTKRQGLLEPLFERLLDLLSSPHPGVRNVSHVLLVRHLKYQPGDASVNRQALAAYVRCLRDPDIAVVLSALNTLTEMVICLQENAAEVLQLVFDLGIRSKLNTSESLRRCVHALKTQHAC